MSRTGPITVGFDGRFLQDKFDGVGRYAFGLLRGLRRVEGEHRLVVFTDPRLPNSRFDLRPLVEPGRFELRELGTPLYSPSELGAWWRQLRRTPVHVFHSPYFWSPLVLPTPLVTTVHDMIFDRHPEYIPGLRYALPYRLGSRLMMRRASAIIAVSEATRQDIGRYTGGSAERRTTVIPNGVDERFGPVRSEDELDALRARYGLPGRFVLALGARRPHKNIQALAGAFERIASVVPHHLVLAGSVDQRFGPQSSPAMARLRAAGRLVEIPRVDDADLPGLYSSAELFVQPSIIEGFGLPALEAMACGCAVACSNTSSLPEVVGEAGVTFDPHSTEAIADAMLSVLSSGTLREDLRRRGRERAARFGWEPIALGTLRVYQEAAAGRRRALARPLTPEPR